VRISNLTLRASAYSPLLNFINVSSGARKTGYSAKTKGGDTYQLPPHWGADTLLHSLSLKNDGKTGDVCRRVKPSTHFLPIARNINIEHGTRPSSFAGAIVYPDRGRWALWSSDFIYFFIIRGNEGSLSVCSTLRDITSAEALEFFWLCEPLRRDILGWHRVHFERQFCVQKNFKCVMDIVYVFFIIKLHFFLKVYLNRSRLARSEKIYWVCKKTSPVQFAFAAIFNPTIITGTLSEQLSLRILFTSEVFFLVSDFLDYRPSCF
jgi:hypothetical protein